MNVLVAVGKDHFGNDHFGQVWTTVWYLLCMRIRFERRKVLVPLGEMAEFDWESFTEPIEEPELRYGVPQLVALPFDAESVQVIIISHVLEEKDLLLQGWGALENVEEERGEDGGQYL